MTHTTQKLIMKSLYKKITAKVSSDYTKPSSSFKKHVWLSVLGLVVFIGLYLGLTFWFANLAYNLAVDAYNFDGGFWNYLAAFGFGFLSLFMAKSLFFLNKREEIPLHKYITAQEEPLLFDYLHQLADDAQAPRPNKVFLSDRVNASVSYDISLINLIFPSKKNLEIGLGLVNVLSLGEFKAVLAHEFGHFAQRSMLLGRYVYIAQQVASRIVGKRDAFDQFLAFISSIDIRISWIGWILSILVWSVRSLVESCFSVVVVAERALSREMEFQADLVAVSLTGSDALIHALYKLQIADEAYDNALSCANSSLADKKAINDLYTLQTNYIDKMAQVLDDEFYGKSPETRGDASFRLFSSKKYNPPKMWATHPADIDRENNAKKRYIFAEIDNQSSWNLFTNPKFYREDMTERLMRTAKVETTKETEEASIASQEKTYFNWTFLHPKYRTNFLNRYAFLNFKSSEDLFDTNISDIGLERKFEQLYPKELENYAKDIQEVQEEIAALLVSKNESLTLEKRRIWHRGNQIKRKEIPNVLEGLQNEVAELRDKLKAHDVLSRSIHQKAASKIDKNWSKYHKKLTRLVHYSEHSLANIKDVHQKYNNVLSVALADGNVSADELKDILNVSHDYFNVLRRIFKHSEDISLDENLKKNMNIENYKSLFEEFKLPEPTQENINEWTQVIDGWSSVASQALLKLRNESLEALLETEAKIEKAFKSNRLGSTNLNIKGIPLEYDTLVPGSERELQRKLGTWDRFVTGDGVIPSIAKFGVAGGILAAAIFYGSQYQELPLHIYNGLQTDVEVTIDGNTYNFFPNDNQSIKVAYGKEYYITTRTEEGEIIDDFKTNLDEHSPYIYNIAAAGVFAKYPIYYGKGEPSTYEENKLLGGKKIFPIYGDYMFTEPPKRITMPSGSNLEMRIAIEGYSNISPDRMVSFVEEKEELDELVKSHVKWDDNASDFIVNWMYHLQDIEDSKKVLQHRLKRNPNEFISLRAMQDIETDSHQKNVCTEHQELALKNPENADFYYLSTRCIGDGFEQDEKFIKGHKKWKDHNWLAYASGYVYLMRNDFENAYNAYKVAAKDNPSLSSIIALDAERVKRILNLRGKNLETIVSNSNIDYYRNLSQGEIEDRENNPDYIYYLLGQGKVKDAYEYSKKHESSKNYMGYLIAASDGATKEMRDEILKEGNRESINLNSVWSAIGISIKENSTYEDLLEKIEPLGMTKEKIQLIIDSIKAKQFKKVDELIASLSVRWKSQVYVLSDIIHEGNIPQQWKIIIKGGLFIDEKPYLEF